MDIRSQIELFKRGTADFVGEEDLIKRLKDGKKLKVKFGADPSAPDLHLGHLVVLRKLKAFQDLGHEIIFLIGDFTGMIGDPSGKSETRKPLTKEDVERNALTYQDQIFKILDPKKTKIVYNSTWLSKMDLVSIMRLMSQYSVARMLERADFKDRFRNNKEISIIEFLYPLMQGYDSVELEADVELGGHDQIFNLLVGRELQKSYGKEQQTVITMPLLEGTDGKLKMSKSYGNYIGFTDTAKDMYGKTMSIPDCLMIKYYELLTDLTQEKIAELKKDLKSGKVHPKKAKSNLAKIFVEQFYGKDAASKSEGEFDSVFKENKLPENIPLIKIAKNQLSGGKISLPKLIAAAGLLESVGEAKRMIKGGGVKLDEEKVIDENMLVEITSEKLLSVGKRKYARVICG
ncbi:MAG: tyrosine--tRNA ligase [Candidatus Margulisiibacteriota bacterium]